MTKIITNMSILVIFFISFIVRQTEAQTDPNYSLNKKQNYILYGENYLNLNLVLPDQRNSLYSYGRNINHKIIAEMKMDSIITLSTQGGSLKLLFEYNIAGNILEQLVLSNSGNSWDNLFLHHYFYDENENLIQEINLGWNISLWDTLSRINYTYNPEGTISQYVLQTYSGNSWINVSRNTFGYDTTGNEITALLEGWQNNQWHNNLLINSFYSDQNRRDSLLFLIWDNNVWQNYSKTAFYYNSPAQYLDSFLVRSWTGANWVNYIKRSIINDLNGNQIEQLDEIWNQGLWENSVRRFYTYNNLNYTEEAYCKLWIGNNWVSGDEIILIENPDGFTVGFITHSVSIYYKTTSLVEHLNSYPQKFVLRQNYPNPFNPITIIKYEIPELSFVALKVYDVLGNEVATLVNEEKPAESYKVDFDGNQLTSGIYFYQLRAGSFVETKKMILLK